MMINRLYYLIVVIFIFSCNNKPENKKETGGAKKSIMKINHELEKCYKSRQVDSLVQYMADDVIQLPPNSQPLKGKESVKQYWMQLFKSGNIDFSIRTQEVKSNGSLAVELGKYNFTFNPDLNSKIPAIVDSGNYVTYWKRIDGNWKLEWDAPVSSQPLH